MAAFRLHRVDPWPCNCKQTPSLRFPIGQELIEYSSCNNFFVSFLCYFVLWSQIIKDFSITHWCSNEIPIITQRYQKHPFISLQEVFKRLLLRSSTNIKYIFDTVLFSKSSLMLFIHISIHIFQSLPVSSNLIPKLFQKNFLSSFRFTRLLCRCSNFEIDKNWKFRSI